MIIKQAMASEVILNHFHRLGNCVVPMRGEMTFPKIVTISQEEGKLFLFKLASICRAPGATMKTERECLELQVHIRLCGN